MEAIFPKRLRGPSEARRCVDPPPDALLIGIEEFNRREFFEQHETLEELWRSEPDDVRYLYQGILQVGVGFYHLGRGNFPGAVSKLASGIAKLRWFEPVCQSVDVSRLISDANRCLETLRRLGAERIADFDMNQVPKIGFAAGGDEAPPPPAKPREAE